MDKVACLVTGRDAVIMGFAKCNMGAKKIAFHIGMGVSVSLGQEGPLGKVRGY